MQKFTHSLTRAVRQILLPGYMRLDLDFRSSPLRDSEGITPYFIIYSVCNTSITQKQFEKTGAPGEGGRFLSLLRKIESRGE